jgi:hypothetical protein
MEPPSALAAWLVRRQHQDELRIARDGDIGVVGGDEELSLLLLATQGLHDLIEDELVIQVVLGLVDGREAGGRSPESVPRRAGPAADRPVPRRGAGGLVVATERVCYTERTRAPSSPLVNAPGFHRAAERSLCMN